MRPARRGRWSKAECDRLWDLFGTRDDASVARMLSRPVASVRRKMEALLRARRGRQHGEWKEAHVDRLKRSLGVIPLPLIARILGRSEPDVRTKVSELERVTRTGPWEPDEVRFLKTHFGSREDAVLVTALGRPVESIQREARRFGLAKDKAFLRRCVSPSSGANGRAASASSMPRWSAEHVARLRELYPHASNLEIAEALRRSVKSVVAKARGLALRKSSDRLARMGRANVAVRYQLQRKIASGETEAAAEA
jgi:hypothetical protein